jgi:hypothetical protein
VVHNCRSFNAVTSGSAKVLDFLPSWNGASSERKQWLSIAELHNAAKSGDLRTVERLIQEGVPLDKQNIRGATPLWMAATNGHKAVVEALLKTNAVNVNVKTP